MPEKRQRTSEVGTSWLKRGSSSVVGDTIRGGSASADYGESRGTCRKARRGDLPTNAKGCAKGETD